MISPKKTMPRTSGTTSRQLRTIHVTFSASAKPTRQEPSDTKNAIFLARLVKRITGLYLTIVIETRAKKNRGAKAPRRSAHFQRRALQAELIPLSLLRHNDWDRGRDAYRRFGGNGRADFLLTSQLRQGNVPGQ